MIICGDALETLRSMESQSVHCCVTSPPYFGLRDYGVPGQMGLEETPEEYVARIVEVMREVRRVLRDDGTLWLNLGDSYAGGAGRWGGTDKLPDKQASNAGSLGQIGKAKKWSHPVIKPKELIGIPWRVAFALQADGWLLRQDIIWHKPNPMPESVRDRCTKAHEYMFLLSKSSRYYFNQDAIKEPAAGYSNDFVAGSEGAFGPSQTRRRKGNSKTFRGGGVYTGGQSFDNSSTATRDSHGNAPNVTGLRNKRSVWTVAAVGYKGAHFATFPPDLIRPCILVGSPEGGIVLDPFFGAGTTGFVAVQHGRRYIGIELNPDYCEMARERIEPVEAQMRF